MRSVIVGWVVVVLALVVVAATVTSEKAFSTGVVSAGPIVRLGPGEEVCQTPVVAPPGSEGFDAVRIPVGTYARGDGAPLDVRVAAENGDVLGRGRLAGGYPDVVQQPTQRVEVGEVRSSGPLSVCFKNRGDTSVALGGSSDAAARTSSALRDDQPAGADLAVDLLGPERSVLSRLPSLLERASLWRPGWVSRWTLLALGLLLAVGVPLLLRAALRGAAPDRPPTRD